MDFIESIHESDLSGHPPFRTYGFVNGVTTAGSTLKAIKAVEEEGGDVALSLTIVDRLEGGRENLEKSGYKFLSLFTRDDLLEE